MDLSQSSRQFARLTDARCEVEGCYFGTSCVARAYGCKPLHDEGHMTSRPRISDAEWEVMKSLWDHSPVSVN